MNTIDDQIDQQHAAALQAEADAKRIEDRIAAIAGCAAFARGKRGYACPPNPWAGGGNMTVQALVHKHDPALAQYLAKLAGKATPAPDYAADAERARRAAQLQAMQQQTEQLRERNVARRAQQDRARRFGTWSSTLGRVV